MSLSLRAMHYEQSISICRRLCLAKLFAHKTYDASSDFANKQQFNPHTRMRDNEEVEEERSRNMRENKANTKTTQRNERQNKQQSE